MLRSIILASLLFVVAFPAMAQQMDTLRRKDADGNEFIQVLRAKSLFLEGNLQHGQSEGVWTEYWDNMVPHRVTTYHKGKRQGIFMDIRRTGNVEQVNNYTNDQLDGPSRRFTMGAGIAEEIYYSEGIRSGSYTKWYDNGKMQEQSNYNHNERDGHTTYYMSSGVKVAEYNYNRGKLEGDVTLYYENGRVKEFGSYQNDEQTGTWKEYWPSGTEKAEGKYLKGEKEGAWKQFDESGKALKTISYKAGKELN